MRITLEWKGRPCAVEAPEGVVRDVARLFSPLVVSPPSSVRGGAGADPIPADVLVTGDDEQATVSAISCEVCRGRTDTLSAVELAVTRHLMASDDRFSHIHAAGALMDGGASILALGASGSGKSSLAYAWYRGGVPVLGDDVVALDEHGRAHAFPRPMKIDATRLVADGDAPERTQAWDPDALEVWVDPTQGAGWAPDGTPVRVVAEIRFIPGAETTVEKIEGPARLRLLLDSLHTTGVQRARSLDRLIALAEASDFFRLRFGDSREAAAVLVSLADTQLR